MIGKAEDARVGPQPCYVDAVWARARASLHCTLVRWRAFQKGSECRGPEPEWPVEAKEAIRGTAQRALSAQTPAR